MLDLPNFALQALACHARYHSLRIHPWSRESRGGQHRFPVISEEVLVETGYSTAYNPWILSLLVGDGLSRVVAR